MFIVLIIGQILTQTEAAGVFMSNISMLEAGYAAPVMPENRYDSLINHYCNRFNVDQDLVRIIIEKESQFNPRAVSRSGALGLMQLMPETAARLGVKDPFNPGDNIMGGVKFLRRLFDMFGGDLELTLAAYHAGPGIVKKLNRVPFIPETMEYVDYILARYGGVPRSSGIYFSVTEEGSPFFTNMPH